MPPPEPSRAVFLSYASQDAAAARRICESLTAGGIEVWFDQSELRGGDAWDQLIRRQIRDCALFIPVISAHTAARPEGYFRLEWALAEQRSHMIARNKAFIVPVCPDDTAEGAADVPDSFQRVQWTRLKEGATPAEFVARIGALLGAGAAPLPEPSAAPGAVAAAPTAPRAARARLGIGLALAALALVAAGLVGWHRIAVRTADGPPDKSIAVLPFADLSEHHDQEYFADGLAEELLDLLAQVPNLRVPARSSSFYFKGKNERVAAIATELHVAHVLEGSVRRAGDTVRVSVELVRADTGFRVWSASYDRDVHDIFRVQDDIATAVVAALKVRLSPARAGTVARRTAIPAAYDQYLLGRYLYLAGDEPSWRQADVAFREAIRLDPGFAPAYADFAVLTYILPVIYDHAVNPAKVAQARQAADTAIALAPDLADGYSARAFIRLHTDFDLTGAQADLDRAAALDPADSAVERRRSFLSLAQGRLDRAVAAAQRAVELAPLDANSLDALAEALAMSGRQADARVAWARTRAVSPNFSEGLHGKIGWSWLQDGALEEARRECSQGRGAFEQMCLAVADARAGHPDEARAALARLARTGPYDAYVFATGYASLGDAEQALVWLSRAYEDRNVNLNWLPVDPVFRALRSDPRFVALLRKTGYHG